MKLKAQGYVGGELVESPKQFGLQKELNNVSFNGKSHGWRAPRASVGLFGSPPTVASRMHLSFAVHQQGSVGTVLKEEPA